MSSIVRALEPDAVPLAEVVSLWDDFDAIERHAAAAKMLLARRVEESRAWARAGHRSAAEFLAERSGSSVGAAHTQLEVSEKLERLPAVERVVRDGEFSGAKTALLVEGASANPAATARLLDQATRGSLKELRDEVLRARAAADADPDAGHRRIHRRRQYRSWVDTEGAWHARLCGTPVAGAGFEARLSTLIDEEFAKARAGGRNEPREAYAFDAVMSLADRHTGMQQAQSAPRYTTIVRADLEALRRGRVSDGEICEIAGIGPIPVSTARDLLGDSVLKLVITKGVDVRNVTHLGRGPSAAQRVALSWSSRGCSVEGCAHPSRDRPPDPVRANASHSARRVRPPLQAPPRPQPP